MKKKQTLPEKNGNPVFKVLTRKRKKDVRKPNAESTQIFLEEGIFLEERIIHLFGDIDQMTVGKVIKGIQIMLSKNKELPIHLYINSYGGEVYSAFGLYRFIKTLEGVVIKTYNVGSCMSAASIIFMAGDERYVYQGSVFMLHSVSSVAHGKAHLELEDEADECRRIYSEICEIYAENSNRSIKDWTKILKYKDVYIRAEEALSLKMVQSII